ncbi:uncharacterized protein LOC110723616 [Chenopodium quinoa]|uniref:uncharacterized protein LOC110723616 n=1 Tax=Chenopodium quinoa TaxID=63459 RepID=UPI000B77CC49|nr:uncharacterized protein LOC110723616 [Chenopodium quinoa]
MVNELFDGTGYNSWKRTMMLGFSSRNKLGFINGTVVQPLETDPNYGSWQRCNDLVIGWLLFSLDKKIAKSVWFYKTASEIWKDLEERFGQTSATQLFSLHQELANMKQEKDDENPLPVCNCRNCVCMITQKILKTQQDQRLMMFLMKLDDKLALVRTNILMMQPLPTISVAHRLCMQDETQKMVSQTASSNNLESMAFAVDRRRFNDKTADKGYKQYNSQYGKFTGQGRGAPVNYSQGRGAPINNSQGRG